MNSTTFMKSINHLFLGMEAVWSSIFIKTTLICHLSSILLRLVNINTISELKTIRHYIMYAS